MSSTSTPIDQKKTDQSKESGETTDNNWVSFGMSVLTSLIKTLLIGLIGANFIFFSTRSNDELSMFFPGTGSKFYSPVPAQSGGDFKCHKTSGPKLPGMNTNVLKSLGIGTVGGWPYSLWKNGNGEAGGFSLNSFENWFSETTADSFGRNRGFLVEWIKLFAPKKDNVLSNNLLQMVIIAPLTLTIGQFIALIAGFIGTLYSAITAKSWGWQWSLIGVFFAYTFIIASSAAVIQFLQFLATFLALPLFSNLKIIKEIMSCNSGALGWLFGALVVSSSLTTLDSTVSTTMIVVYVLLALKAIIF